MTAATGVIAVSRGPVALTSEAVDQYTIDDGYGAAETQAVFPSTEVTSRSLQVTSSPRAQLMP